eukprot:CAMPEP_0185689634 /NCGR_PEP_ID=MMETSP1164-20130828/581_1 /TAXON_ID=1104430 /ORGANISM="Chrysoreinhardia sp, Strain CCMP2950" /LENGTH=309 /DNA_ID=CAMNT_0028356139 /DNA_START=229 /DNA_END=1159 /DNA_ORIENTATION=+
MTLYSRMVRRFSGDETLWLEYLVFLGRHDMHHEAARLFTGALKLHPNAPILWLRAAIWHHAHNGSVARARSLLIQGLKSNSSDSNMWAACLWFETLHIQCVAAHSEELARCNSFDRRHSSRHAICMHAMRSKFVFQDLVPFVLLQGACHALPQRSAQLHLAFLSILQRRELYKHETLKSLTAAVLVQCTGISSISCETPVLSHAAEIASQLASKTSWPQNSLTSIHISVKMLVSALMKCEESPTTTGTKQREGIVDTFCKSGYSLQGWPNVLPARPSPVCFAPREAAIEQACTFMMCNRNQIRTFPKHG